MWPNPIGTYLLHYYYYNIAITKRLCNCAEGNLVMNEYLTSRHSHKELPHFLGGGLEGDVLHQYLGGGLLPRVVHSPGALQGGSVVGECDK